MYSGLAGVLGCGCLLRLGLGSGLGTAGGGSMYETPWVDLEEIGSKGGIVQWLMMVELVFEGALIEARGVIKRGASAKSIWISQV